MAHEQQAEARIRAAMNLLLTATIPEGLKCDIKSLCTLAGVPRATLYRTYPHLKAEFEHHRDGARASGHQPDPRLAQIERLKSEVNEVRARLARVNADLTKSEAFRAQALSRLTAQHDEISALCKELESATDTKVRTLRIQ
jgi:predicted nuclease with TOPRIM domain